MSRTIRINLDSQMTGRHCRIGFKMDAVAAQAAQRKAERAARLAKATNEADSALVASLLVRTPTDA